MNRADHDVLLSAYLDGQLAPAERQEIVERLATDAQLREQLAQLESLRKSLAALPTYPPSPDLRERILARVRELSAAQSESASESALLRRDAKCRDTAVQAGDRPARRFTWRQAATALTALAAALLVVLFMNPLPDEGRRHVARPDQENAAQSARQRQRLKSSDAPPSGAAATAAGSPQAADDTNSRTNSLAEKATKRKHQPAAQGDLNRAAGPHPERPRHSPHRAAGADLADRVENAGRPTAAIEPGDLAPGGAKPETKATQRQRDKAARGRAVAAESRPSLANAASRHSSGQLHAIVELPPRRGELLREALSRNRIRFVRSKPDDDAARAAPAAAAADHAPGFSSLAKRRAAAIAPRVAERPAQVIAIRAPAKNVESLLADLENRGARVRWSQSALAARAASIEPSRGPGKGASLPQARKLESDSVSPGAPVAAAVKGQLAPQALNRSAGPRRSPQRDARPAEKWVGSAWRAFSPRELRSTPPRIDAKRAVKPAPESFGGRGAIAEDSVAADTAPKIGAGSGGAGPEGAGSPPQSKPPKAHDRVITIYLTVRPSAK